MAVPLPQVTGFPSPSLRVFFPWDLKMGLDLYCRCSDPREKIWSLLSALGKLEDSSLEPIITWFFSFYCVSSNKAVSTGVRLTCLFCSGWSDLASTCVRYYGCEARAEHTTLPELSTDVSTLTKPLRLLGIWFSFLLFSSIAMCNKLSLIHFCQYILIV